MVSLFEMFKILVILLMTFAGLAKGQSILTVRQVFDFNVGDEFEYSIEHRGIVFGDSTGYRNTILERRNSKNSDTVTYKIKVDAYEFVDKNSKRVFTFKSTIMDTSFTQLDSNIGNEFRLKYRAKSAKYTDSVYFHKIWGVNTYEYKAQKYYLADYYGFMGKGIGMAGRYTYFDATWYIEELRYYKKGSTQFGTHDKHFELASNTDNSPQTMMLFPNPVASKLYFSYPLKPAHDILIMDYTGNAVLKVSVIELMSELDLSYLTPGFYYLIIENNQGKSLNKFIKQ